jgi:hypothetical protein
MNRRCSAITRQEQAVLSVVPAFGAQSVFSILAVTAVYPPLSLKLSALSGFAPDLVNRSVHRRVLGGTHLLTGSAFSKKTLTGSSA